MKKETFRLLDAINREGIDNGMWGFCQDIKDTTDYFGTAEKIELKGQFVYVYREPDTLFFGFIKEAGVKPTHTLTVEDKCSLLLRKGFIFVLSANLWKKGIMTISNPRNNALNGG